MHRWRPEELSQVPREGIFYLRGTTPTRLETFVDAAFAFAVTLLVISIDSIPESYEEFIAALLKTPAFVCCFFQLMMFWIGHRAWSRRYGMDSILVLWISLVLVAGILVIVYPLRLMFGAGLGFISGGLIPADIEFTFEQLRTLFVLYSSSFCVLSLLIALLFWLALRNRAALLLTDEEVLMTRGDVWAWLILSFTGVVSITIALLAEGMALIWAGWVYATLAITLTAQDAFFRKQVKRMHKTPAT